MKRYKMRLVKVRQLLVLHSLIYASGLDTAAPVH